MAAETIFNMLPSANLPKLSMADILMADHRDTMVLLEHFTRASNSGDNLLLEKLTDAIALVIRLHSQAEMDVLYPVMEKDLGKKESHIDECFEAHNHIEKEVLEALKLRKEGGGKLTEHITTIFDEFQQHLHDEEDKWVLKLVQQSSQSEMDQVAVDFMKAKENASLEPQA